MKIMQKLVLLILIMSIMFTGNAFAGSTNQLPTEKLSASVILKIGSNLGMTGNTVTQLDIRQPLVVPVLIKGVLMVPVRYVANGLGASVSFNKATNQTTLVKGSTIVRLKQGQTGYTIGSTRKSFPTAAFILKGHLYAPALSLASALGSGMKQYGDLMIFAQPASLPDAIKDKAIIETLTGSLTTVQRIKSKNELTALLSSWQNQYAYPLMKSDIGGMTMEDAAPAPSMNETAAGNSNDYSETNIQVKGVDEGDILKTDGSYLFHVKNNRVFIIQASPISSLSIVSTIDLDLLNVTPTDLYVAEKRLVIVGSVYNEVPLPYENVDPAVPQSKVSSMVMPWRGGVQMTKVLVYDISNPGNPLLKRDYEVEGYQLSSRRIGQSLILVTNKSTWNWYGNALENGLPFWKDNQKAYQQVQVTDVRYYPNFQSPNWLIISTIPLADTQKPASLYTILGAGSTMYATTDTLYLATQNMNRPMLWRSGFLDIADYTESTDILKFSLKNGITEAVAKGIVPGRILNQFSMDEHNGNFRIATTVGWSSQSGKATSWNNVYLLDTALNKTGSIENIAPGEQIYSTRFLGDRAYMVTYRTTDPLYVMDLSNPTSPKILGELKIPGYSNYLHPIDENHIVGFGKDAIELESQWDPGTKWAYYQGMKVALFDVTDVANPVLQQAVAIGDRGTDSELLWNHKALLYQTSRSLMAFPVNLHTVPQDSKDPLAYGELTWQGMMVYQVSATEGFREIGRVSHLSGELYDSSRYINRGATIGNVLYTLSQSEVQAHSIPDMQKIGALKIP